jgi:hypothetical protein
MDSSKRQNDDSGKYHLTKILKPKRKSGEEDPRMTQKAETINVRNVKNPTYPFPR